MLEQATRRTILAAFAAAPVATAPPAYASLSGTADVVALDRDLGRVAAMRKAIAGADSDALVEVWSRAWADVLRRVEALPATREAARVRAKAILEIYGEGPLFDEHASMDYRLVRQLIETLTAN